jgi:hypothetical protein
MKTSLCVKNKFICQRGVPSARLRPGSARLLRWLRKPRRVLPFSEVDSVAVPRAIPAGLDVLVDFVRDHSGLGCLIERDESPNFCHIPLIVLLVSNVNDAGLFVLVYVEGPAIPDAPVKLVGRQRSVEIALSFSLGDASQKAAFRERSPLCSLFKGTTSSQNQRDADRYESGDADCSR